MGTEMNSQFRMAGTEGSYRYVVVAVTKLGRVGYRELGNDMFRVRVEPANDDAQIAGLSTWKQPDPCQHRWSRVVEGQSALENALTQALQALSVQDTEVEVNPDAPAWAKALVTSAESVDIVMAGPEGGEEIGTDGESS